MDSVVNPRVPYVGPISRSFTPGKWLKIYGTVAAEAFRFTINLQCSPGTSVETDIALQITVNLLDNNVSVNSMRKGIWDEAQTILGVPIKTNEKFEFAITCDFTHYKVSINGEHYCEFPQRIVYNHVTHLTIDGDISIQQIIQEAESFAPMSAVPPPPFSFRQIEVPPPSYNEVQSKVPVNYGSCALPTSAPPYNAGTQFIPALPGYQPYPVQPGVYPTHTGTMIPLNAASSNFRPVSPSRRKKYTTCACLIFILFIIIAVAIFNSNSNRHQHHHRLEHDHGWDS